MAFRKRVGRKRVGRKRYVRRRRVGRKLRVARSMPMVRNTLQTVLKQIRIYSSNITPSTTDAVTYLACPTILSNSQFSAIFQYNPSLEDFGDWDAWGAPFEQYRIKSLMFKIYPLSNLVWSDSTSTNVLTNTYLDNKNIMLHAFFDYDAETIAQNLSFNDFMGRFNAVHRGFMGKKPITIKVKPRPYGIGTDSVYQINNKSVWIDNTPNGTVIPYGQLNFMFEQPTKTPVDVTVSIQFRMLVTAVVEFKGRVRVV